MLKGTHKRNVSLRYRDVSLRHLRHARRKRPHDAAARASLTHFNNVKEHPPQGEAAYRRPKKRSQSLFRSSEPRPFGAFRTVLAMTDFRAAKKRRSASKERGTEDGEP